MGIRHPNHRLVKIHRNYTVEEAATLLNVHRNTVREWIKQRLPTIDAKRPTLIHGRDLAEFLKARRQKNRHPCRLDEIYCVRCRIPVKPAGGMVDYKAATATLGNLIGMCPGCESLIYRRINITRLDELRAHFDISVPKESPRITESGAPSVNCALGQVNPTHDDAQSR
jgi:excisionase family DNA binding protein